MTNMQRKHVLASAFAIAAAAGALVLPAFAADPPAVKVASVGPGASLDVAYTISFWGIPFGETNFDSKFRDDIYTTVSHFETTGIASAFWEATIDANSNGHYAPHAISPYIYDSYYRRGSDKNERVKVTFSGDEPTVFADPPYNLTAYPVTTEQKKEGIDPLSAVAYILTASKVDASKPCGTVAPVFDGRRRYNITFTYLRDEQAVLTTGVYKGKAHLCQMHYDQIAGFKPKILKEGKAFPPIFGWFADIPSADSPNGHYFIALRVWASTGYGTVSAELNKLKIDGGSGVPKG
jgi:Protein of unknown function (DUF3108)